MTTYEKKVWHALIDKDMQLKELASQIGYTAPYIRDVLQGNRKSEKVRKEIERILDVPYQD